MVEQQRYTRFEFSGLNCFIKSKLASSLCFLSRSNGFLQGKRQSMCVNEGLTHFQFLFFNGVNSTSAPNIRSLAVCDEHNANTMYSN